MATAQQELLLNALGEVSHDLQEARRRAADTTLPVETRDFYRRIVTEFEAERERLRAGLGIH